MRGRLIGHRSIAPTRGGRRSLRLAVAAGLVAAATACTDHLPDQDLRIIDAQPVERLSAALLWQDFQMVPEQAARNYNGKAIVVMGEVTGTGTAGTAESGEAHVFFAQTPTAGVYAGLLAEQASSILAGVAETPRVRLKCYCEGLSTNVILKSCVTEQ
jgi:hypothetical protein